VSGALLTTAEVAELLGRSQEFVRGLVADGVLEARQVRRRWFIPRRAVEEWLAPTQGPQPEARFPRRVKVTRRG
jgi:excisionase family DNA binding protein